MGYFLRDIIDARDSLGEVISEDDLVQTIAGKIVLIGGEIGVAQRSEVTEDGLFS
jgi:hypothetical protein